MGWVLMSERELQRAEVLTSVANGRLTATAAAGVLDLSRRQVHRLLAAFRDGGASGLRHGARGRRSNRALSDELKARVLALVSELYSDFGPTLLSEVLQERHEIRLSRETLRVWMSEAGLWLSRRQRRSVHQLRLRREHLGELVQIDGSEHRWFEDRGLPCSLLVFIDDATGRLMQLRFVKSESTFSYFEALRGYLRERVATYPDLSGRRLLRELKERGYRGGYTAVTEALREIRLTIPAPFVVNRAGFVGGSAFWIRRRRPPDPVRPTSVAQPRPAGCCR